MRYFFLFFLSILLNLPVTADDPVIKKAELRILDIGNSYTIDATSLLPQIAKASKADLSTMCLYRCYRSGGSFKNWVDIYNDKDTEDTYTITKVVGGLSAKVQIGKGEAGDGKLFRNVLTNETWDLIIIHQFSTYAPYYSKWNTNSAAGYLDELISIIKAHQPSAELGFLLVHSYWSGYSKNTENSSHDRWQLIANSAKSFCEDYNVDFVIPYGTAIQNLRSSSFNNEYDLTRDGTHCGYGLAQYTAACCYYESLIAPRCGISVLGNTARIDVSDKESEYPSINVTDENAFIAQEAAYLATKDMYHCQNPEDYIFKLTYSVDGEVYKSVNMAYGMPITPEPAPSKEGYSFSGWSDIPSTMPVNDVTVTGSFKVNKYKLTYMVDGAEYKSYEMEYGAKITPEPAPTKEDYSFSGWSEIPQTMPANDVTVIGSFKVNKYSLVYMVDGAEYKSYEVEYGANITPEAAPEKEGYSFSGWSEIPQTMPANDVTVSGSFKVNKYRLIYMVDGAEYKSYEVEYGAKITPEPAPSKEDYSFSGWSEIPQTMPAKDVTVTGSFKVNKYRLFYMVDGAEYKSYEVEYGANITPEAAPEKEGYSFSGWSDIPQTMPANDVTVTGSFKVNKYRLTYMVDGAEYKSYEVEFGAKITPEADPVKEGYSFSSWSNIPQTMPAQDVTVTGSFKVNKYRLTYMVDGAEYKSYEVEYGANITPEAAPEREGYTFSGWSDIPNTMPAKDVIVTGSFIEITGIISVINDSPGALIYDMQGRRIDRLQKGVNIIHMNHGGYKKVVCK